MAIDDAKPGRFPSWRRVLFILITTVCGCYLALVALLFYYQAALVFPGTRGLDPDPSLYNLSFQPIELDVMDEKTVGCFLPAETPRGTVLFSHGNGGNIAGWVDVAPFFHRLNLN